MGKFAEKLASATPARQRAMLGNIHTLVESKQLEKYYKLLTNFDFLAAKVQHPEFGVQALIEDYDLVEDNNEKVKTLKLIQGALRLSAHILDKDGEQLPEQLWGRMQHFREPEIQELLLEAKQSKRNIWLQPLTTSLTPPGGGLMRTITVHSDSPNAVVVTPDGKQIVSCSSDGTTKVWSVETGAEIHTIKGHSDLERVVAVTPDGKQVVSCSFEKTIKCGVQLSRKIQRLIPVKLKRLFSERPKFRKLGKVPHDVIKVWNIETGTEIQTLKGHTKQVSAVAFIPDSKQVISGSMDTTIKVWDIETGTEIHTLKGHRSWVSAVAVTPDGKQVISGSMDTTIKVWDIETGTEIHTLKGHRSWVSAVAITPDGKQVISGSWDKTIKVWSIETGAEIFTLKGHSHIIRAVAITPNGKKVVSASDDNTIKVWSMKTRSEIHTLIGHNETIRAIAVTLDGKQVISVSINNDIKVWSIETGTEIHTLKGHRSSVYAVAVTPDGKQLVSGSSDNTIKVWDIETRTEIHTLKGHRSYVMAIAVTPDGKRVISGSWDHTIKVWDIETGTEIHTLKGHRDFVDAVAVRLVGKQVISASRDKTIKVWSIEAGTEIHTLKGHRDYVYAVAVTPDNKQVISASRDKTIKVWSLDILEMSNNSPKTLVKRLLGLALQTGLIETGAEVQTLTDGNGVNAVAVTPDGKQLISGSNDNTIKVWCLETGVEIHTLTGHSSSVRALAVTPDGKRVISGSNDNTIKVWCLETRTEIASLTGDSNVNCCAVTPDGMTIVAGERSGNLHFLRLEGMEKTMNNQPQLLTPTTPYPTIFQQYIRQKTENYVDRSLISTTINNFLQNHNHGYFTLIGAPGSGKSAILANYTIQNPQTVYYTAEVEGKNRADEFLITLCTQLIQKIDEQNLTLPDNVTEGSWFLSLLLQKISDNLTAEEKLIIVVDGCDYLHPQSQPRDSNIFYLPRYLPKQVYFLLARRPFLRAKSGLLIETPAETLNLEEYPEQNREDVRAYIEHYLAIPGVGANIKSWVAENYQSEAEFCRELVVESGNNFMYLSRVLGVIPPNPPLEGGDRNWRGGDMNLPASLEEYYQGLWQKMGGEGLSEIELGVLRVLVEQEEAVSVEAIERSLCSANAQFIDVDEYDIEEVLETWLEFLHQQEIEGEICYSLYHWSFRKFLQSLI